MGIISRLIIYIDQLNRAKVSLGLKISMNWFRLFCQKPAAEIHGGLPLGLWQFYHWWTRWYIDMYYFSLVHSAPLCCTLLLKCGNAKSYIHSACVILHHTSSGLHFKLQLRVKPIFLPIISKAHFMPAKYEKYATANIFSYFFWQTSRKVINYKHKNKCL